MKRAIILRVMDNVSTQNWLKEMSQQPDWLRYTVIGAGVAGDPVHIPWIIEHMEVPELARVAGEAFTMTTGVDIALFWSPSPRVSTKTDPWREVRRGSKQDNIEAVEKHQRDI